MQKQILVALLILIGCFSIFDVNMPLAQEEGEVGTTDVSNELRYIKALGGGNCDSKARAIRKIWAKFNQSVNSPCSNKSSAATVMMKLKFSWWMEDVLNSRWEEKCLTDGNLVIITELVCPPIIDP